MGGSPRIPKFGDWSKSPEQAEGYTDVFNKIVMDKRTPGHIPTNTRPYPPHRFKQYKASLSPITTLLGFSRPDESKLPNLNTKEEVMTSPYKPEMSCDPGPSIVAKKESERADDSHQNQGGDSINSADSYAVDVNSAGGVPIEQSHLPKLAGGASDKPSSFDRSNTSPAPDWAQSGAGNTGYKAMSKLKERLCDVVFHKKNFGVLQTKIQVLTEEVAQVQSKIQVLLISGENDSKDEVQHWLAEAHEVLKETNGVVEGRNNMAGKKHLCRTCWDPIFSWETGEMLRDIDKILEQRKGLDLSSYFCELSSNCKKLKTRENKLQDILEALMDIHINMIGIYGMIGVGKSVLVKELVTRAQNEQLFDVVVMVQVSESIDVKLIQSEIANKIGMQLSGDVSEEKRAHFLYSALEEKIMEQQSKILVILDGLQCVIELGKVGIPYGREGRASCKVVLISRNPDVCKKMGAEKQFLVECLNLEEAKMLFQERLGDKIERMEITLERYQSMENVFLLKCRGLPLVIDTLACTLRSMSWPNWEIIVGQMERHALVEVDELKEVPHAILELCNNFIQKGKKQKLLLLCFLIQQGMHLTMERLKRYGIGFGLFGDTSLAYATHQLNLWIDELKSLSILLESKDSLNIKMHDIIQDVVISALSQGDDVLDVRLDAGTCWYTRESYENCIAISVMPDGNDKCLNGLELHKLQALLLKDRPSLSLPDNYFQGMQNLRILDIYGTTFVELPSSIGNLNNLVTLHLECCRIKCISSISNLAKLEVLSLRGSSVEDSPVELGNLINLRVLDLTRCGDLFHLGVDALVRLDQLRELYIRGSSRFWTEFTKLNSILDLEVLEIDIDPRQYSPGALHCSSLEFERLEIDIDPRQFSPGALHYSSLELELPNIDIDPRQFSPGALHYSRLRRFIICIEDNPSLEEFSSSSNVLVFNGNGCFQLEESGLIDLLQLTKMLQIKEARGLCNGVGNLSIHGFLQLKNMYIQSCREMECIVDANELTISQRDVFPELQILTLKDLPELKKIWCGQPSCSSFPKLSELILQDLILLHPHVLPIQLATKLRCLKVINCQGLLFIFPASEIDGTDRIVKLPYLENLELEDLKRVQTIQDPSNASFALSGVLFNGKIEVPSLKDMCLVNLDRIKKLWDKEPYARDPCFRRLKSIKIDRCRTLKCLFSTSIVDSLLQLEELEVLSCPQLKEVITSHAEDDASPSRVKTFPKLQTLKLQDLSYLQYFYRGSFLLEFPALRVLTLHSLRQMKTFIDPVNVNTQSIETEGTLFTKEVSFRSLENLQVSDMNVELIQGHPDITTFSNLSSLTLKGLRHLKSTPDIKSRKLRVICLEDIDCIRVPSSIWPINMPRILALNVEELTLSDCVYQKEQEDKHNLIGVELLSSLRNLKLMDLKALRNIQWNVLRNLRSLIIHDLNSLTSLISTSLLLGGNVLHHLEYVDVEKCKIMHVIISEELPVDEDFVKYGVTLFPSLRRIRLVSLSNLQLFSRGRYEALFPSLETVEILDCESFQSFSLRTCRTPRLKSLQFCGKTLQTDIFDDFNVILEKLVGAELQRRILRDQANYEEEQLQKKPKGLNNVWSVWRTPSY